MGFAPGRKNCRRAPESLRSRRHTITQPRLALVSIGIRRDLLAPLVYFSKFELVHFYKKNVYGDLTADDFDSTLRGYHSPRDLEQQLVRAQPTVIQGVEPFSFYTQPLAWACVMAARKTHAALVVPTFENRPLDVKFGKLRAIVLRRVLQFYFARACLIFALNNGARENVLQCHVAPHKIVRALWGTWGVDTREFFPHNGRNTNQSPIVLFTGRLHEEKGVFVLLDAFQAIQHEFPEARLVMAGDGPARGKLAQEIAQHNISNVELRGIVKNRDVPALMRQADLFCAPSLTTRKWAEQVGMSALQAMASGLPIVSTRSGAIPEYIPENAGILVRENDAGALAQALRELLTHPERAREMGRRAADYARMQYDAQKNIERAEQLVMEHCVR